jgi:hypothetical protein
MSKTILRLHRRIRRILVMNLGKRELMPIGTKITVRNDKPSIRRYHGMTGEVIDHGPVVAAFDHLVKLDQMGEARWFSLKEILAEGFEEENIYADSTH